MITSKRIALVVNALAGVELKAGAADSARVFGILVDKHLGACDPGRAFLFTNCADRDSFNQRLLAMVGDWNPDDQLLLYFSGHGVERHHVYNLRFGAEKSTYFPFKNVLTELQAAGVRKAIIILDSCQSGAVLRVGEKDASPLPVVEPNEVPKGIAIVTSCRANQQSHENGDQTQSVFTDLFCRAIETGLGNSATPDGKVSVSDLVGWINKTLKDDPRLAEFAQTSMYGIDGAEQSLWIALNKSGSTATLPSRPRHEDLGNDPPPANFNTWLTPVTTFAPDQVKGFRDKLRAEVRDSALPDSLDDATFLARANLMSDGRLFAAGVLLFSERPEERLPQAYVQCSEFAGTNKAAAPEHREIYGPLLRQLDGAMAFIQSRIESVEITQQGALEAKIEYQYPMACIREVLANALCHRDYLDDKRHTHVRLFTDRIEISSPGSWCSHIIGDEQEFQLGALETESAARNERLAASLRRVRLVETAGSGIPNAVSDCAERGAPLPIVVSKHGSVVVKIFPRANWSKANFERRGITTTPMPSITPQAARAPRHNLPRQQRFVGRERELGAVRAALDPESRAWGIVITGAGGVGKTSLAVHAAHDAVGSTFEQVVFLSVKDREFDEDGVRAAGTFIVPGFFELLNELARELDRPDITKAPEDQRERALLETLRGRAVLLVLDNVELLSRNDRDRLSRLINRLPDRSKAIVTSRQRFSSGSELLTLDKLDEADALAMIQELARHDPLLARTTDDERLTLYRETGGNPLLLGWLVGQLGRGSCRTFDDALRFLRSCPPDNDPLEFIFGDIVPSCGDDELRALTALSYFKQPATLAHLSSITDLATEHVETALQTLANRALVVPDQNGRGFSAVPMVGEFLRRREPHVAGAIAARLRDYVGELVAEHGGERYDRFPAIDREWPTVSAALPLIVDGPNDQLQQVCDALNTFLDFSGRWDERLSLAQRGEEKAEKSGDSFNAGWRAYDAGQVYRLREQSPQVLACADRALAHWEHARAAPSVRAAALSLRGYGHEMVQNYAAAASVYDEASASLAESAGDDSNRAVILNAQGRVEVARGNLELAEQHYREALSIARRLDWAEAVPVAERNLATVALARGEWAQAQKLAEEALRHAEGLRHRELTAATLRLLAVALIQRGERGEAAPHARRAVAIYEQLGSPEIAAARATLRRAEE